ncbi:hypothetical protein X742_22005 [Mesorhizobium sp. LNHC232B00]|nr:hypothetical protein X742_22005 [Mesorhizobium sp. LNHC232B00]
MNSPAKTGTESAAELAELPSRPWPGNATNFASVHFPTRPVAPPWAFEIDKFYYPAKIYSSYYPCYHR